MNNNCSSTHTLLTLRWGYCTSFFRGRKHATRGKTTSAANRVLVCWCGRVCDVCVCVRRLIPELECVCVCVCVCVNQQPVCICSILHPALIPQGLGLFLVRWRLIRGQLVRDTRAIVLTLTVGHWNANREHTKPNGVEEQQIFGQDPFSFFFFFHWWSRPVYGRWNKVRADGHSANTERSFEQSSNQIKPILVETGRRIQEPTLQSPLIKDWTPGRSAGWHDPS